MWRQTSVLGVLPAGQAFGGADLAVARSTIGWNTTTNSLAVTARELGGQRQATGVGGVSRSCEHADRDAVPFRLVDRDVGPTQQLLDSVTVARLGRRSGRGAGGGPTATPAVAPISKRMSSSAIGSTRVAISALVRAIASAWVVRSVNSTANESPPSRVTKSLA